MKEAILKRWTEYIEGLFCDSKGRKQKKGKTYSTIQKTYLVTKSFRKLSSVIQYVKTKNIRNSYHLVIQVIDRLMNKLEHYKGG